MQINKIHTETSDCPKTAPKSRAMSADAGTVQRLYNDS